MSMLNRYRKSGGFLQLVILIETCPQAKQEKFLEMIEKEDIRWANAIKQKMLSIEKVFGWGDTWVTEIVGRLTDLTVAMVVPGLSEIAKGKVFRAMSHSRKRTIDQLMVEKKATPNELVTIHAQILTEVRGSIAGGYIYLDRIDPNLIIDDSIEERLANSTVFTISQEKVTEKSTETPMEKPSVEKTAEKLSAKAQAPTLQVVPNSGPAIATASKVAPSNGAAKNGATGPVVDGEMLRDRIQQLMSENSQLREKLGQVEFRLSQIRKLAG